MLDKASKEHLVYLILRSGGNIHPVKMSTVEFAHELGISQQSASRWLAELEEERMIERSQKGVRITKWGLARIGRSHRSRLARPTAMAGGRA